MKAGSKVKEGLPTLKKKDRLKTFQLALIN